MARCRKWQRDFESLWSEYCTKRDFLVDLHKDCLAHGGRTPRLVFIFAATKYRWRTYRCPIITSPKKQSNWLRAAIRQCDYIIANPEGKYGPE